MNSVMNLLYCSGFIVFLSVFPLLVARVSGLVPEDDFKGFDVAALTSAEFVTVTEEDDEVTKAKMASKSLTDNVYQNPVDNIRLKQKVSNHLKHLQDRINELNRRKETLVNKISEVRNLQEERDKKLRKIEKKLKQDVNKILRQTRKDFAKAALERDDVENKLENLKMQVKHDKKVQNDEISQQKTIMTSDLSNILGPLALFLQIDLSGVSPDDLGNFTLPILLPTSSDSFSLENTNKPKKRKSTMFGGTPDVSKEMKIVTFESAFDGTFITNTDVLDDATGQNKIYSAQLLQQNDTLPTQKWTMMKYEDKEEGTTVTMSARGGQNVNDFSFYTPCSECFAENEFWIMNITKPPGLFDDVLFDEKYYILESSGNGNCLTKNGLHLTRKRCDTSDIKQIWKVRYND